jgi:hypothetical protein
MRALSASMSAGCEAPQALESETALEVARRLGILGSFGNCRDLFLPETTE